VLVMAPGSVSRALPIPGLAEAGIGFKTIGEAIHLRNHILSRLDVASTTDESGLRRKALTFVFVGGGYSGVEAFAELEDMARHALHLYPGLSPSDMRWLLVEATGRILPEVGESLGAYTVERLRERGMEVLLDTTVESMVDGRVVLSDGEELDAGTVVWTAGIKANPLASRSGLPVDHTGRIACSPDLRVKGVDDAWGAGDSAAVPDLSKDEPGATCAPSAQHAVRQAKRLADNVVAVMRGAIPKPYIHADAGSVASLGLYKGVAEVYGVRLRGFPAWLMHRGYHLSQVPTLSHKARVAADWAMALLFGREVVSLGQVEHPRWEWQGATLAQAFGSLQVQVPHERVEGFTRHG
jgi:NADH dehydrogenase FAD-containing subunit